MTNAGVAISPWVFFPLVVAAGAAGGAAWAAIVALLRDRFNANEILVSLMLVYVADLLLSLARVRAVEGPARLQLPADRAVLRGDRDPARSCAACGCTGASRSRWSPPSLMWVFMFRTYRGIQLQIGGPAPAAARYAGFSSRAAIWTSLLVSGALAGIAGAFEVAGPMGQLTPHVASGYGFTAIIVAFVGRLHPLGAVLGSVVLSAFVIGGELAQSRVGLPSSVSGVFQGILLLSLLGCDTLIHHRVRLVRWTWRAAP